MQKAGTTYSGPLYVTSVQGTASLPVIIDRYGTGAAPRIANLVSFVGSSYVTFQNFTVAATNAYAGIAVRDNSAHIRIISNSITNSTGSGIFLGTGCNNGIYYNIIHDVAQDGIVVNQVACTGSTQTLVYKNTIYNTGVHGVELHGNYFIIDANIIHDAGTIATGASGIHIYGGGFQGSPPDGMGNNNWIVNNVVSHAHEPLWHDGNGIMTDKYTHDNMIYGNLIFGNGCYFV